MKLLRACALLLALACSVQTAQAGETQFPVNGQTPDAAGEIQFDLTSQTQDTAGEIQNDLTGQTSDTGTEILILLGNLSSLF